MEFNLSQTATLAGVRHNTLCYHRQIGAIPEPKDCGKSKTYTGKQDAQICEYFSKKSVMEQRASRDLFTIAEAARMIGVDPNKLSQRIREGRVDPPTHRT